MDLNGEFMHLNMTRLEKLRFKAAFDISLAPHFHNVSFPLHFFFGYDNGGRGWNPTGGRDQGSLKRVAYVLHCLLFNSGAIAHSKNQGQPTSSEMGRHTHTHTLNTHTHA